MPIPQYSRLRAYDGITELGRDETEAVFRELRQNPLLNGTLLENISLANGDNFIPHKLGRTLKGWIITRHRETPSSIIDRQTGNPQPDLTLCLNSSVAAVITVDIWVF